MHAGHRHYKARHVAMGPRMNIIHQASLSGDCCRLIDGEILFKAGQKADHIFLVERGSLLIVDLLEDTPLRRYSQNELIGIPEVLADECWSVSAIARGITDIRVFPAERVRARIDEMDPRPRAFISELAKLCA